MTEATLHNFRVHVTAYGRDGVLELPATSPAAAEKAVRENYRKLGHTVIIRKTKRAPAGETCGGR